MKIRIKSAVRGAAVLATVALALTACTNVSAVNSNASQKGGASAAAFDPTTIGKDEALAALVPTTIKSRGTLIIGTTPTYAPGEFLGGPDNNTPMGYDIDFAKAIAATLGLRVDVQSADFSSILPSLGPKFDLGLGSFTINKKRLDAVNMVSYFEAGTSWAVQKGNPKNFTLDDVCGKSVGVQTGTVQETDDITKRSSQCTASGKKAIDVVSLKTQAEVSTRLANGSIDAMAADSPVIGYAIQQTGTLEKTGDVYGSAPEGIAVVKSDVAFAGLVQKVITKLMTDGDYKKILGNWNVADGALPKSELNPAL